MSEEEEKLEWQVQKKMNFWKDKRKYKQTIEELFNGNVRYLKFIKNRIGQEACMDAFKETIDFTSEKYMSTLRRLGASLLSKISKKILLKRILGSFFINMQHVVDLNCIKKLEFYPDYTEIIIEKCTAKRAWKIGLKNNKATDMFTFDDYCKYSCTPLINKFLELTKAQSNVEFKKRGCHHIIKFIK